jgi:hypothetical protein
MASTSHRFMDVHGLSKPRVIVLVIVLQRVLERRRVSSGSIRNKLLGAVHMFKYLPECVDKSTAG